LVIQTPSGFGDTTQVEDLLLEFMDVMDVVVKP